MTSELLGPRKGDCECGCGIFGTLRRRPLNHVRGCPCKRCQGKRNRTKGDSKARQARKTLGLAGVNSRHEEHWGGPLRIEVKSGSFAKPVATKYYLARAQSEAHRPIGDTRPFVLVVMPDGTSEGLAVIRLKDLATLVEEIR